MRSSACSLYDTLLGNFSGELPLSSVAEEDHVLLSVLDNLQRILRARAGTLAHLPDYGLPDSGHLLHGVAAVPHQVQAQLQACLLKYEPRLRALAVQALPAGAPGELRFALQVTLYNGQQARLHSQRGADGRLVLRHLRTQGLVERQA